MEQTQEMDIGRYLRLLYKKKSTFIVTAIVVATIIIVVSYVMPKKYEAKSTILIEKGYINNLMKDVAVTQSIEERTRALSVVMKSRYMILRVLGDLDIDISRKNDKEVQELVKQFQDSTGINIGTDLTNRMNADIFIVSYTGSDPRLASDYVNALVRRYVEEYLTMNREAGYGANRFLSEQIGLFREKIDSVEAEIAKLSKEKGGATEETLVLLEKKLNELLVQYTENHPEVIKAREEIAALKKKLRSKEAGNSGTTGPVAVQPRQRRDRATPPVESLPAAGTAGDRRPTDSLQPGDALAWGLPAGKKTLQDLMRTRDAYKKIYEELLAALGRSQVSTQVEAQDKAGAFRILDPAIVPKIPVSPNRVKMILLGIFGGIATGFGVIILMDMLDHSIKSVDQLRTFGLPVLAVIPAIRTEKESARRKKKDALLYTLAGVYFTCVLAIFFMEFRGLPYVDNFVQGIKTSVKNIF